MQNKIESSNTVELSRRQAAAVFCRSKKPSQFVILFAYLLMDGVAQTIKDLCEITDMDADTVRKSVEALAIQGLLVSQTGAHGRVTWLCSADTLQLFNPIQSPKLSDSKIQSPKVSDSVDGVVVNVEYKSSLPSNTTTSLTTGRQKPKTSDSGINELLSQYDLDCLSALKEAGIHGKKAKSLLRLNWVTPEYIQAHWSLIQTEDWDNPQGMMIYRMEGEVPAPETINKPVKSFYEKSFDLGKKGFATTKYTWDILQDIADFMGHEKGCKCFECGLILSQDGRTYGIVCEVCKKHECECEDAE